MAGYTLERLASKIELDLEDYSPLLQLFVDISDSNLAEISSAVAVEDSDMISFNIHNIKGAALNLGLDKIADIAEQMSTLNKAGSFADIEAMVEECEAELNDIRKLLE